MRVMDVAPLEDAVLLCASKIRERRGELRGRGGDERKKDVDVCGGGGATASLADVASVLLMGMRTAQK
jgi:hypothetical protein